MVTTHSCIALCLHWLSLIILIFSSGFWIYACFAKVIAINDESVKPFDRQFKTDTDLLGVQTDLNRPEGERRTIYYNASYQKQSYFNAIAAFLTGIGILLQVLSEII
ncbi:hypothetical protein ACWWD9_04385 [Methylovorus sp. SPW-M1]